ncbi:MAG: MFS transporter [Rhodospirillaceae bacterium]|nr:MFS transporter [Rhodospirillaceae bacterium]
MSERAGIRAKISLGVVGLGSILGPLDSSVNIAFPDITRSFEIGLNGIQWVIICFVLTQAGSVLIFGKLGDLFGHKKFFTLGLIISVGAHALCASSSSFGWFLVFRVPQGIGIAMLIGCGPALATFLFPEKLRGRVLALYTMMFALGMAIGPALGGLLVQQWGWPGVFWFRVPIALAALLLMIMLPKIDQPKRQPRLDLAGAALLIATLSAFILALNQLQQAEIAWLPSGLLFVTALLCLAGFIHAEGRAPEPVLRLAMFQDRGFSMLQMTNLIINLCGFTLMVIGPHYLVREVGLSVIEAGLVLALSLIGGGAAGLAGNWLIIKIAPGKISFSGVVITAIGLFGVALLEPSAGLFALAPALFAIGLGLGLFQLACLELTAATLPRNERGVAGGLVSLTRMIGMVICASVVTGGFEVLQRSASFVVAFQSIFLGAGILLTVFLIISLSRREIWFSR